MTTIRMTYEQAAERLGRRASRKVANNTYLQRRDDETIALMLHATDVVTFRPGTITLDSGGWRTMTTSNRMSYAVDVFTRKGVWYVTSPDGERWDPASAYPYADGIVLDENGYLVEGAADPRETEAAEALRKRINAYANLCGKAAPIEAPSEGDCWFCAMFDDGTGDTDHLLSHMDEGYVVPSLVYRALAARGYPAPMAVMGSRRAITFAVREYMKVRLMPSEQVSGFVRKRVTA